MAWHGIAWPKQALLETVQHFINETAMDSLIYAAVQCNIEKTALRLHAPESLATHIAFPCGILHNALCCVSL